MKLSYPHYRQAWPSVTSGDLSIDQRVRSVHLATDVEIGIGTEGVDPAGLRSSYEDAVDSLRLGRRLMHGFERVTTIDQVRIEQLLSSVSLRVRRRYATAVAAGLLTRGDWPTMRSTVVAWCESGFSLVGAARRLHVHRNTLIHRLEKIEELQGWSERSGQAYLALYLACKASEFEVDKSQAE